MIAKTGPNKIGLDPMNARKLCFDIHGTKGLVILPRLKARTFATTISAWWAGLVCPLLLSAMLGLWVLAEKGRIVTGAV